MTYRHLQLDQHYSQLATQQVESPQNGRDRLSTGSEFNQISPILTMSPGNGSDFHKQSAQNQKYTGSQNSNHYCDMETPNTLVKEFYRQGQQFYQGNMLNESSQNNEYKQSEGNYSSNRQGYNTGNFNSVGVRPSNNKQMRDNKQEACTDFDLTAKEISSNKRFEKGNKNTILSGRASHSPLDGPPSNSETVKWAFSNKDSQETQKKISIINRESINAQDLISRSLKSHDSRGQSSQQQLSSNNQIPSLKGKVLDFGSLNDPSRHQIESGLFYNSNQKASEGTFDSQYLKSHPLLMEEGKMISFLEDETDILISGHNSLKKNIISNKHIAGIRRGQIKDKNHKCLVGHVEEAGEMLQGIIGNDRECMLCNRQKVYDSSLQGSVIEEPKSHTDIIKQNLEKKYLTSREYYNVKIINDIIYNEQTHIVSVFKDYLIFDDISEFLKRGYNKTEILQRLPRMFEFYEKYSKVFANYVILPENKYLFKNIEKKQRIIDEKQRILSEKAEREQFKLENPGLNLSSEQRRGNRHKDRFSSQQSNNNQSEMSTDRMFDTKFLESVANIEPSGFIESMQSSRINNSRYQDHQQNSSVLMQLQQNMDNKKKKRKIEDLDFDELISKFIQKDSESNIQQSTIFPIEKADIQVSKDKQTPLSQQPTQKKPQVYEYQQKNVLQPSQILPSENTKQQQTKRLSQESQKQKDIKENSKILNYNIYNNYNQFINNENYYISSGTEDNNQLQPVGETEGVQRGTSLQRNHSRSNLHQQQLIAEQKEQKTPLKTQRVEKEKTPQSNKNKEILRPKSQLVQQTEQQSKLQELKANTVLINSGISRSTTNQQKSITDHNNKSPANLGRTNVFTSGVQSCRAQTEALVSREMSKEKRKENIQIIPQKVQIQQPSSQPQMFKNDMLLNLAHKLSTENHTAYNSNQMVQKQQDYSSTQRPSSQVRSVERMRGIEEEIQQDYSKYVNEYGLTQKTAFAQAVNALREKQTIVQQQQQQKQGRGQNSNEKKRGGSQNNMRSGSTSQSRKGSQNRQKQQENVNDLYMNRNDKQIRSVRTKTLLNSNNSSCFQRSTKLSPDKYGNSGSQFLSNYNLLGLTQTINQNNASSGSYMTLKAQPSKQSKGIKIKFPLNSQRGSSGKDQNTSKNQTPKRLKLQKTKSTSNIPLCFTQRGQISNLAATSRSKINGMPDVQIYDEMSSHMNATNPTLLQQSNVRGSQNMQDFHQYQGLSENQIQALLQQQQTFQSSSCGGTYTTTSILNSPLGFKQNPVSSLVPNSYTNKVQQQQIRNTSKPKSSSRNNGSTSQHQSHKSISGHQRATSSNLLQNSNSKLKTRVSDIQAESKRMSAGSNLSKKSGHHQAQPSNMQQQILQLLMSYQTQQEADSTSSQFVPMSQTLKTMQQNTQSMKDLKQINKQPSNLIKDLQILKASKNLAGQSSSLLKQPPGLNTQRSTFGLGQQSILMLNQGQQAIHPRKTSKSGKTTQRGDTSKKRVITQQNIVIPYQQQEHPSMSSNQFSNFQNSTGHELSSRIQNALMNSQINDQTSASSNYGDQHKRILSYSKSSENLDMIRAAAQKAMENQQQNQDNHLKQSQVIYSHAQNANKFLQNLKQQQETHQQISLSKIKLMPPSAYQQLQQPILQSARNNYDQSNFRSNNNENSESHQVQMMSSRGPTNIIINQNFADKNGQQSRRTSAKFNPSSTKSNQQFY